MSPGTSADQCYQCAQQNQRGLIAGGCDQVLAGLAYCRLPWPRTTCLAAPLPSERSVA